METPIGEGIKGLESRMWDLVNENTELKKENYYLKLKMKEIQKIVGNYDIYES